MPGWGSKDENPCVESSGDTLHTPMMKLTKGVIASQTTPWGACTFPQPHSSHSVPGDRTDSHLLTPHELHVSPKAARDRNNAKYQGCRTKLLSAGLGGVMLTSLQEKLATPGQGKGRGPRTGLHSCLRYQLLGHDFYLCYTNS